jgi:hypothetical protein
MNEHVSISLLDLQQSFWAYLKVKLGRELSNEEAQREWAAFWKQVGESDGTVTRTVRARLWKG